MSADTSVRYTSTQFIRLVCVKGAVARSLSASSVSSGARGPCFLLNLAGQLAC